MAEPTSEWYPKLLGQVEDRILRLQDGRGGFLLDKVDERSLKYFYNNCVNKPWNNHILFIILIQTARNLDPGTVRNCIWNIQPRMEDLFRVFSLDDMSQFNVDIHMYKYLKGEVYPEHSDSQRQEFLTRYKSSSYHVRKWLAQKLDAKQQSDFLPFLLPEYSFDSRDFSFSKRVKQKARGLRKDETDAILPYLPIIRETARFRYNQIKRLREAFQKAVNKAQTDSGSLPLSFHYDEPKRVGERFYFRLWDKPSFVLHYEAEFSPSVVRMAQKRKGTYSDDNNHFFVEFIKAERIQDDERPEGLWFLELIEQAVLGLWSQNTSDEEIERKREYLYAWGYGEEDSATNPIPFYSMHKGIISQSTFVSLHKDNAEGLLFDVEPLYAGCTFGLLATDVFTTTGARINELLQISNTRDCITLKKLQDKTRYSFWAVPKGRDEVEEFYVSHQTMEYVQIVARMLKDHYQSDKIPSVRYEYSHRRHLFPDPKPFFFQYNGKAMGGDALSASVRFLLHGLRFETQSGSVVTVKSHLLRHAFSTEARQRHKMPVDILAKILHQRDVTVTDYYSEPTSTMVAQAASNLHDVIASYVDIDEAILRSPKELQQELEEHKKHIGVLNKVLGGTCVTDFVCPTKMACLGCKAKVPEPEQEHELYEVIELSKDMEKRFAKIGLGVEVKKAIEMRKQARIELQEIESIKKYREERHYEPTVEVD